MGLLQDLASRLAIPGLPDWTGLLALLLLLLAGLAYLLMPFSVFGLKGRLDSIEAQLDDLQAEIRSLSLQLRARRGGWRRMTGWNCRAAPRAMEEEPRVAPPVPPPAAWPESPRGGRSEPRVDWPGERGR